MTGLGASELGITVLGALTDAPVWGSHRLDLILRLVVAGVMGGLLGWERSRADKPADTRTMVLVAVGAAGFAALGLEITDAHATGETIRTDPTRVLSYIISGVGFLGAGAILHSKKSVRGLTTAAAIWAVAAIGAACGLGQFEIAFYLFAIVFTMLWSSWVTHALFGPSNGNGHGGERDSNSQQHDAERHHPDR